MVVGGLERTCKEEGKTLSHEKSLNEEKDNVRESPPRLSAPLAALYIVLASIELQCSHAKRTWLHLQAQICPSA